MTADWSRAEVWFGANSIPHGTRTERGGSIGKKIGSRPKALPGSRGERVAASIIRVTTLLASVLVFAVAGHLTRSALGELWEEIILVVVSVVAMACVIASLLIHGRRIIFWPFFAGFIANAVAQANDDPILTTAGVVLFVGPLAWNMVILGRLSTRNAPCPRSTK
jgi:hypothetical protein